MADKSIKKTPNKGRILQVEVMAPGMVRCFALGEKSPIGNTPIGHISASYNKDTQVNTYLVYDTAQNVLATIENCSTVVYYESATR